MFLLGIFYSFGVTMLGGSGWTKTIVFDIQNEKLLTYFLVFLLGALCFKLRVFDKQPTRKLLYIAVSCTVWIPMNVYFFTLLSLLFRPGEYFVSGMVDVLMMWSAYYVSMLAMLYVLVATFRFYRNKQGKLGRVLNASSYGVYIVHLPVIGGIALLLLGTEIPSLWKYLILTVSTYAVSNVIVHVYREVVKPKLIS